MHPGATAIIKIDNAVIGYIGRVHPNIIKHETYVGELSLSILIDKKVRDYKFKELNKFPNIIKDVAFVLPEYMESSDIEKEIKRAAGNLLKKIEVFDLYRGPAIKTTEKSIAYSLTFESNERTLTSDEVNELFNKIIDEVTKKMNITIRN